MTNNQYYLIHSGHKYLKREWKNGQWKYTYDYYRPTGTTALDKYRKEFEEASKTAKKAASDKYQYSKALFGNPIYKGGNPYTDRFKMNPTKVRTTFLTRREFDDKQRKMNGEIDYDIYKAKKRYEKAKGLEKTSAKNELNNLQKAKKKQNNEVNDLLDKLDKSSVSLEQYSRNAMGARYKYLKESAAIARQVHETKLSNILKKSVREVINTKSIKKGYNLLKELLQNAKKIKKGESDD